MCHAKATKDGQSQERRPIGNRVMLEIKYREVVVVMMLLK
jgi:hypothetical protein